MDKSIDLMRVLILSISKRTGHQHAAQAVENSFHQNFPSVHTISRNFFEYIKKPMLEKVLNKAYFSILKNTPELWDYLYNNQTIYEKTGKFRQLVNRQTFQQYKESLEKYNPSVIICTQSFPCEVTACLKRKKDTNIPLVAIVTDFVAHAYWANPEVDLFIVPTERTKVDLMQRSIPERRIKILGLPIEQHFEDSLTLAEKRDVRTKVGLDKNLPTLLVMGGGHGFGPMKELVETFEQSKVKCELIIVAGFNTKLRRELNQLKKKVKIPLHIFGYVNNIHELMSVSDILITKPGGMTSTEALVKRLPMIIIHPLPGQEEKNSEFLVNAGAALRFDSAGDVVTTANTLLSEPYSYLL